MSGSPKRKPSKGSFSFDDFLADFRPMEKVVPITTRGDLVGALSDLESELARAQDQASDSIGEGSDVIAIAKRIEKLRTEVQESSRDFRVVAVGDRAWSDLIAAHEPDEEGQKEGLPWNVETFYPAALAAAIAEPQMTPDQVDKLIEVISAGQVRKLIGAMLEVNGGGDDLPKSDASSVLRQASRRKRRTVSRAESLDLSSLEE